VVAQLSMSTPAANFTINRSSYDLVVRVATGPCTLPSAGGPTLRLLMSGSSATGAATGILVNLTAPARLAADDVTMLYVKAPAVAEATGGVTIDSIELSLEQGGSAASSSPSSCQVAEVDVHDEGRRSATGSRSYSTSAGKPAPSTPAPAPAAWVPPATDQECEWDYGKKACKYSTDAGGAHGGPHCAYLEASGDQTMSDSCHLTSGSGSSSGGGGRRLWEWPSWLNPWSDDDDDDTANPRNQTQPTTAVAKFNDSTVDELAGSLVSSNVEPEDGCWYFCSVLRGIAGEEKRRGEGGRSGR
jgi:hypothetical protein